MFRLIASRLIQFPLILSVVFVVTFVLAWVVPGDPLSRGDGRRPAPEIEAAMRKQYNLDSPLRFAGKYVSDVVTRGDFGPSLQYQDQRVADIIAKGLPVSATVGIAAVVMALFIGMAAGVLGALKPGSMLDSASLAVALVGVSLPTFVTGALLIMLFAGVLHWVDVGAWGRWHDVLLPALTLSLAPAAYIARLIRLGLAEVMSSDFIRTARAKGLSQSQALRRHALKVAFLPVLSFLGPAAAATMTGSFVVEQLFNLPGIGRDFVTAVTGKDQFLILGVVLVYATILVTFNLIVDVAYAWVDPRIEL